MSTQKLRVAIVGASGYAGAELARLLAGHPCAQLTIATASGERAGARVSELFPSLRGICDIECREPNLDEIARECDFAFLALPHGKALEIVPRLLEGGVRVCDIGADFRLRDGAVYEKWYKLPHTAPDALKEAVYGLPEWNRAAIVGARLVANPGCYPTSAILALAPLLAAGLIEPASIVVDSGSGSSGAGRSSYGAAMHHPEVSDDYKAYGVAAHRHTPEIEQGLADAAGIAPDSLAISFTPHLLPIARGILSTCYAGLKGELDSAGLRELLARRYEAEPFVRISPAGQTPQIKHVVGGNFCDIGGIVDARARRAIVIAAEDNLVKGAAGQAIQNMNLMCGFDETLGLRGAPVFP